MQRTIKMTDGTERTVTFDRMGHDTPSSAYVHEDVCEPWYNEDTGMEYELYPSTNTAFPVVYVAANHEDVGLVTWYRFDSRDDARLEMGAH